MFIYFRRALDEEGPFARIRDISVKQSPLPSRNISHLLSRSPSFPSSGRPPRTFRSLPKASAFQRIQSLLPLQIDCSPFLPSSRWSVRRRGYCIRKLTSLATTASLRFPSFFTIFWISYPGITLTVMGHNRIFRFHVQAPIVFAISRLSEDGSCSWPSGASSIYPPRKRIDLISFSTTSGLILTYLIRNRSKTQYTGWLIDFEVDNTFLRLVGPCNRAEPRVGLIQEFRAHPFQVVDTPDKDTTILQYNCPGGKSTVPN